MKSRDIFFIMLCVIDRSYGQYCALAQALDLIGERWTILIIRELLVGPRRFKDLLEGLPNISTNLLSERLKKLELENILIKHRLPPPADVDVYELTSLGQSLEESFLALSRWGVQVLSPLPEELHSSLGSEALKLRTLFNPELAKDIEESYELHIDNNVMIVSIQNGTLNIEQGSAKKPDLVLHTGAKAYAELLIGELSVKETLLGGQLHFEGDREVLERFVTIFKVFPIASNST